MEPPSSIDFSAEQQELSLVIALEDDKTSQGELGTKPRYENDTPESQYSPRELVTEKETSSERFYLSVRCQRPVFGKYKPTDKPTGAAADPVAACRVVLDVAFLTSLTDRKFKKAVLKVSFIDGVVADLAGHEDEDENEAAIEEAMRFAPRVLDFAPRQWWGREEVREGEVEIHADMEAGVAAGPAVAPKLSTGYRKKQPVVLTGRTEIEGAVMRTSDVKWSLKKNVLLANTGIITQFSTPMIVQYHPGRPFAARVEVAAEVEWRFHKITAGKLDHPIRFDPDKIGARDADEELNGDLKSFCNLGGYDGDFRKAA